MVIISKMLYYLHAVVKYPRDLEDPSTASQRLRDLLGRYLFVRQKDR